MRRLELLNLALLVALLAFALWAYPQLPERIPTHFNARGQADAWSARTVTSWFLVPVVAVFLTALMYVSSRLISRKPQYVNLPSKAKLLELPAEDQQPILREVQRFVLLVNAVVLVVLSVVEWATYRTALGQPMAGALVAVLVLSLVVLPVLTIGVMAKTTQAVTRAHHQARLRGTLRVLTILLALTGLAA